MSSSSSNIATTTIKHTESGSRVEIHPFGATIVSFVPSNVGRDLLFVSSSAKLDGSKAIRGGIPLVFPVFGPAPSGMPQHGFLRNNMWTFVESSLVDNDEAAECKFQLELGNVSNGRGEGEWSKETTKYNAIFTLCVKIDATSLTTTLGVENVGPAFDFQALLHTYLRVQDGQALDPEQCFVTGLEGYTVDDKITEEDYVLDKNAKPITIEGNVDRVYSPPSDKNHVTVIVGTGRQTKVQLKAFGKVDGTDVPTSCVVWNPYKDKAAEMSDFTDEQYLDMICVEPGILMETTPKCTKTASLTQVLTAM